jgi:hypothetical protein
MTAEPAPVTHDQQRRRGVRDHGFFGGIYGMGFIGAAIYSIGHATTFWVGVLGFLEALIWPTVLMYNVLELLQM